MTSPTLNASEIKTLSELKERLEETERNDEPSYYAVFDIDAGEPGFEEAERLESLGLVEDTIADYNRKAIKITSRGIDALEQTQKAKPATPRTFAVSRNEGRAILAALGELDLETIDNVGGPGARDAYDDTLQSVRTGIVAAGVPRGLTESEAKVFLLLGDLVDDTSLAEMYDQETVDDRNRAYARIRDMAQKLARGETMRKASKSIVKNARAARDRYNQRRKFTIYYNDAAGVAAALEMLSPLEAQRILTGKRFGDEGERSRWALLSGIQLVRTRNKPLELPKSNAETLYKLLSGVDLELLGRRMGTQRRDQAKRVLKRLADGLGKKSTKKKTAKKKTAKKKPAQSVKKGDRVKFDIPPTAFRPAKFGTGTVATSKAKGPFVVVTSDGSEKTVKTATLIDVDNGGQWAMHASVFSVTKRAAKKKAKKKSTDTRGMSLGAKAKIKARAKKKPAKRRKPIEEGECRLLKTPGNLIDMYGQHFKLTNAQEELRKASKTGNAIKCKTVITAYEQIKTRAKKAGKSPAQGLAYFVGSELAKALRSTDYFAVSGKATDLPKLKAQ